MCFGYDGDKALEESLAQRGLSRRGMLRGAAGGVLGALAVGTAAPAVAGKGPGPKKPKKPKGKRVPPGKISIQLWTLRDSLGWQDNPPNRAKFDATMRTVADIGYPKVEQALGYFGRTAAELRAFYDSIGISATSSHDGLSANAGAAHQKFANAVTLGQRYVNVPYLASSSRAEWEAWADAMNAEAAIAKGYGLRYGYHNHAHEFTTDLGGGVTPWQILTDRLDPKLVHLEIDLYWAYTAGVNLGEADPDQFAIDVIADAPQRVRQFHVKDRAASNGDMADLGTGVVDFARIFRSHRVEEYIVENDTPDVTPEQTAEVGYEYLWDLRY